MSIDRVFIKKFIHLTIPFSLQLLIASAVNLADVFMIGKLGEAQIAAVGAANQIFFLLTIIQFGIGSGASVFIAQYWGAEEKTKVKKVLGLMYVLSSSMALLFMILGLVFPEQVIRFYIPDRAAVEYGSEYLYFVSFSYLFTAVSTSLATICRNTGNVTLPTVAGIVSMAINVLGNAIFIFGLWGAPEMGLKGAAIATVIARALEMGIIISGVYLRKMAGAASWRELMTWEPKFLRLYFRKAAPVLFNEIAWSVGSSLYIATLGLMGTSAVAAVQIATAIAQILFVFVRGAASAAGVILGNTIGEGKEEQALADSKRFLVLIPVLGLVVSGLMIVLRTSLLQLYGIQPEIESIVSLLLVIHAIYFVPKAFSVVMIVGILRSGGDTTFACLLDILPVWLFSLPFAFLAVRAGFPLWAVFVIINAEDVVKLFWGIPRVISTKWLQNLTKVT